MPTVNPRVLVVEDDPAIRALLSIALRRKALLVDCASDGIAGLDMLGASRYAVIVIDLMMPRMNGFAFLETFAKLPLSPPPVVFVMTAYDDSAFRKLDATIVHGFFRKPFDIEQVSQTIVDCALLLQEKIEEAEANRRRARESAPDAPLRVLIAEDDPDYRAWVVAVVRRLGCAVDFARDGASALEQLTFREYDIAVIDHEMPRINGTELIARIRGDERMSTLYAVMLTARDDFQSKMQALSTGFDDFVSKSSPEAEIVARLGVARRIATRQRSMGAAIHELRGFATRDELTGVFNRRVFLAETERMLARGTNLNVVLFDLDEFKQVNDTLGHLVGDRVLRDVGAVFHRHTRPEDLIARYGGDEFVMVVPDLDVPAIEGLSQRLAHEVRALQWYAGEVEPFHIGVTIGIASSRLLKEPSVVQLLDAADRDLYKNKWMRRNPNQRLELYEYPESPGEVDLLPPIREVKDPTKRSGVS
ncbi:MAG TPA: response regulator [Thermoanaerobaculia bacterium]|jgi:diguanylate cyclase (GGDEF)-like protein|nr:response regulator [Thermoanaerobaculia bacterium]